MRHYHTSRKGCQAKPKPNIARRNLCWPGTDPIPQTNHREEHRARAQAEQSPQGDYLKYSQIARLSILKLSKTYPFNGILSHIARL
jgi:hypothetical protein